MQNEHVTTVPKSIVDDDIISEDELVDNIGKNNIDSILKKEKEIDFNLYYCHNVDKILQDHISELFEHNVLLNIENNSLRSLNDKLLERIKYIENEIERSDHFYKENLKLKKYVSELEDENLSLEDQLNKFIVLFEKNVGKKPKKSIKDKAVSDILE